MGTGAHVGLESDFLEVGESVSSLNICVVLKDPIEHNIIICLTISGGTAVGKGFDSNAKCVHVYVCVRVSMHTCMCACMR